ncbi:MAG: flagellar export protein FliJ [Planctomycetota bacterium]|jgi:flagellar export protein FliJ
MPKFTFRLEPLLKARRRAEQDAQRAVAQLQRQRMVLEDTLRNFQRKISHGKESLRGALAGSIDMRSLRLEAGASLHLVRKAQQVVLQMAGLNQQQETARVGLIEARKHRRALELLREQRYEQWKRALNKAEDARLDELATNAAARKEADP